MSEQRQCPKRGQIWLLDGDGRIGCYPTTCKTKKCRVCGPKRKAFFEMLVEYGMRFSTLNRFYFITLTYRAGKNRQRTAPSVREDWRSFLLWLNEMYPRNMWVRAMELTKKGQPHLHLVLSFGLGINPWARCERKAKYDWAWRNKSCDCLEHLLSGVWNGIVPDSYVVDVREARKEDAGYLAKYVGKANQITDALVDLGFTRTWSRSRSWPVERFQLLATVEKSWKKMSLTYPADWKEMAHNRLSTAQWRVWSDKNPFMSVGTDLNWEMEVENEKKRVLRECESVVRRLIEGDHKTEVNRDKAVPGGGGSRGSVGSNTRWRKVA